MHKRLLGTLTRKGSNASDRSLPNGDSPEATASRGVRLFCESGGPQNTGDEVLHLPMIVEAAESSPAAASQAAAEIRRFLSTKNYARAYVQYNAIMLVRILADNPGKSFTRNVDSKFVGTVKDLLREGKDISVQQILRETLEFFEKNKANDETLANLRELWQKEKAKMNKRSSTISPYTSPAINPHFQQQQQQQQNYFARQHKSKGLPTQAELAQRVEEAKTSAKLLTQLTQTTPPQEVLSNDLLKEFADRCASASRSMQSYIHSNNPAPDEDTLLTLIETNDALAGAMSRHQRAVLQARRMTSPPPNQSLSLPPPQPAGDGGVFNNPSPPPQPPPQQQQQQGGAHSIFNRASDNLRSLPPQNPPPSGGIGGAGGPAIGIHEAPSPPPPPVASTNGVSEIKRSDKGTDPFADSNETALPGGMQAPLVPQSYGLPPDNVPVPGSPKGDSFAFTHTGVDEIRAINQRERDKDTGEKGGDWSTLPSSQTATVLPRGEPPLLQQAPKQRYRF